MPTHQRLRANDRKGLQDRREPAIELDEEPPIAVRQLDPAPYLASQDDQLMLHSRILRLKPPLRLEWRGQRGKNEEDQRDHRATLADSVAWYTRIWFSIHTQPQL